MRLIICEERYFGKGKIQCFVFRNLELKIPRREKVRLYFKKQFLICAFSLLSKYNHRDCGVGGGGQGGHVPPPQFFKFIKN